MNVSQDTHDSDNLATIFEEKVARKKTIVENPHNTRNSVRTHYLKENEMSDDEYDRAMIYRSQTDDNEGVDNSYSLAEIIEFAEEWSGLGGNVASQVRRLISDDPQGDSVNRNAIEFAYERLQGLNDELDDILMRYLN